MAKQQPSSNNNKRADMIYCERCGEDYSATYRRCPFCDERPGRRIDEHGLSSRSPFQLAVLVGSLIVILAAAFIVFTKVAPLLTSRTPADTPVDDTPGQEELLSPETQDPQGGETTEEPGTEEPAVPEVTDPSAVPANAVVLSREDITLVAGETYSLSATVSPADTTDTLVWSCDKPDLLDVAQDGTITNKNATGEKAVVTVTVTAGNANAQCLVRCNSSAVNSNNGSGTSGGSTGTTPSTSGGASISGKTEATVVGATAGLNVRSGPGSSYEKVASIENGSTVTILENTGTGWYKIDYGANKVGYASVDYIQPK